MRKVAQPDCGRNRFGFEEPYMGKREVELPLRYPLLVFPLPLDLCQLFRNLPYVSILD